MTVLTKKELKAKEAKRDIDAEVLEAMAQILAGKATVEYRVAIPEVVVARQNTGLTQSTFADLLGVSKRTLQEWEQDRKKPSKAAQMLIKIAMKYPNVLRELQEA